MTDKSVILYTMWCHTIIFVFDISDLITTHQQPTPVPDGGQIHCACPECSSLALIVVSVVCGLLSFILVAVAVVQCTLMVRMRKFLEGKDNFEVVMSLTTTRMDIPDPSADLLAVSKLNEKNHI